MDRDAMEDELNELEQVHRQLDIDIERKYTNYLDDQHLGKMKIQKLAIKRSIEKLRKQLGL